MTRRGGRGQLCRRREHRIVPRCSSGKRLNGESIVQDGLDDDPPASPPRTPSKATPPPTPAAAAPARVPSFVAVAPKTPYELSLDSVRSSLIRQEETIIFGLIERAQFRVNAAIYTGKDFRMHRGGQPELFDRDASFLEYMLCETEKLHARVRRYTSPEEHAFFPTFLPAPLLPPIDIPQILAPHNVNVNRVLLRRYIEEVVPVICELGDDDQHGSSVICDIHALQALSRRVHLGLFVAESKYQEDGRRYRELCKAGDAAGVNALLTNAAVEARVLRRAFDKASAYGRDVGGESDGGGESGGGGGTGKPKVEPASIAGLYRDLIIPLTKDVEIEYLFQRTGYACPPLVGLQERIGRAGGA
ncbi:unnamed protein product [Phaeothamnion confervicola]